jgi:hypothetical protein
VYRSWPGKTPRKSPGETVTNGETATNFADADLPVRVLFLETPSCGIRLT